MKQKNTNFKLDLYQYEDIVVDDPEYESLLNYYAKTFNNNTDNNTINIEDLIRLLYHLTIGLCFIIFILRKKMIYIHSRYVKMKNIVNINENYKEKESFL